MRIWLDCTSLMDWRHSHLTGIQRTVLGIYKGWKACGIEPRLYRYHQGLDGFVEVTPQEFPELIRKNLENKQWITITPSGKVAKKTTPEREFVVEAQFTTSSNSLKQIIRRSLLGEGPSAEAMLQAAAGVNLSLWRLKKATAEWLPDRLGIQKINPKLVNTNGEEFGSRGDRHTLIEAGQGDYLFSIGSECFQVPEPAQAIAALRNRGARLVRMIYDLIPIVRPQWVIEGYVRSFRQGVIDVMINSDHILTISEYSRQDILRFAAKEAISTPPITVIRLGDALSLEHRSLVEEPEKLQQPTRPFFLCLGTLEPRKNHRLLYEAWRLLSSEDPLGCPDLVCIGAHHIMCKQQIYEMTCDPLVKDRIYLLQGINDNQLEWYYRHCIATVFPSLYEGWGLPVAESLARGRLCLASNTTSIPEISDLTEFINPWDSRDLAALIKRAVASPEWRAEQEERIRTRFKQTSWKTTAQHTLRVVENTQLETQDMQSSEA